MFAYKTAEKINIINNPRQIFRIFSFLGKNNKKYKIPITIPKYAARVPLIKMQKKNQKKKYKIFLKIYFFLLWKKTMSEKIKVKDKLPK